MFVLDQKQGKAEERKLNKVCNSFQSVESEQLANGNKSITQVVINNLGSMIRGDRHIK